MKELLLGIDIGTSAVRSPYSGRTVSGGGGDGDYKVYYPKPGYAEQDPDEWWRASAATKGVYHEGSR